MSQYYYIDKNDNQQGPVALEQMATAGITPDTMVWTDGMADWLPAKDVFEVNNFLWGRPQISVSPRTNKKVQLSWIIIAALSLALLFLLALIAKQKMGDHIPFFSMDESLLPDSLTSMELDSTNFIVRNRSLTVKGVTFDMIYVEGGTFTMGKTDDEVEEYNDEFADEKPTHEVSLSSFMIGKTEVTQELWRAVMGDNPSAYYGNQRPVENVSWDDCQSFVRKLNKLTGMKFRLPTEAEWEYTARGGKQSKGYKYAGSNSAYDVAVYDRDYDMGTADVATKAPNELGIYDMSGNVWEWCQDWYDENYYSQSPKTNPTGPTAGDDRVFRGGDWGQNAGSCRVSHRYSYNWDGLWVTLGLRLAL